MIDHDPHAALGYIFAFRGRENERGMTAGGGWGLACGGTEKKCKRRGQWREKCTGKLGSLSFSNSPTRLYELRQKQLLVIFPGG